MFNRPCALVPGTDDYALRAVNSVRAKHLFHTPDSSYLGALPDRAAEDAFALRKQDILLSAYIHYSSPSSDFFGVIFSARNKEHAPR